MPRFRLSPVSNIRLNFIQPFEYGIERYAMLLSREVVVPLSKPQWRQAHPCPNCGRTMQLFRSTAHTGGISEIRSFGCAECGLWTSGFESEHED